MKVKTNPFAFGKVVSGDQFFNRNKEIAELKRDILNHQNIILYAPRRYGKTSLVLKTFNELRKKEKKFAGLFVDFYKVTTIEKFVSSISNEYAKNAGLSLEKIIDVLKNIFTGISPSITLDNEGNPKLEFNIQPSKRIQAFEEAMNLPAKLSSGGKTVAVFFDEFQEVVKLDGFEFQKKIRAIIQLHDKVSYIFCGSKFHLFQDIFNNKSNPLFNIGKKKYLDIIPEAEYTSYISKHFSEVKDDFSKDYARAIYSQAGSIPYNIQILCHEIYNLALLNKSVPFEELLSIGLDNIINRSNEEYILLYDNLSKSVKLTLEIIIHNNGCNLFNSESLSEFRIAPSTLKKALNKLIADGIIISENKKYLFQDIFFKKWVEKNILDIV